MEKYYTRACNFYYGEQSKSKIKKKIALPLCGNDFISFDTLEIVTKRSKKKIYFKDINFLHKNLKKKVKKDLKKITAVRKIKKLDLKKLPILMGVINLTPDSFSDGGKYKNINKVLNHAKYLNEKGCAIIDVGGESTRPGSHGVKKNIEWKRIGESLKRIKKFKYFISLDTRKSWIMQKGINLNVNLINDVSGLEYDLNTIDTLKKNNIPFIIHHTQGNPNNMQKNPQYKNVLLDIYDFFEKKIKQIRDKGIKHNNIILDPGIGFGKNLKHNITLISNISIFHSLGFPILLGVSRKKFIKELSGNNDSKERLGGTISSSLYAMMHGVQILRVHDVNEINQSLKVFKSLNLK